MNCKGDRHMSRLGVAILGSTGSIGTQTLDVISRLPDRFRIVSLAARNNRDLLSEQVALFRPDIVVAASTDPIDGSPVLPTPEGLIEAVTHPEVDIVVAATSGHDAIRATWAAIEAGKTIALANKETIVCAGDLIIPLAARHGADLRPVDSEHSAIWQALMTGQRQDLARLILTASGGPFLRKSPEELAAVSVADALAHPNWSMGSKITVDSASMMNKGLEIIEAHHLFNVPYHRIDVVIHREQIIHSLVEWSDRSSIAQLSFPDMRLPIQYALTWPERPVSPGVPLDFTRLPTMSFELPSENQFPLLRLAKEAGVKGATYPTVLSAADELAVGAFLAEKIRFVDIPAVVEATLAAHDPLPVADLETIFAADEWARHTATEEIARFI